MIVYTHLKNSASDYFRAEAAGKFNSSSPNILSNKAAPLSLFLEYAQGDQRDPETDRPGKTPRTSQEEPGGRNSELQR